MTLWECLSLQGLALTPSYRLYLTIECTLEKKNPLVFYVENKPDVSLMTTQ